MAAPPRVRFVVKPRHTLNSRVVGFIVAAAVRMRVPRPIKTGLEFEAAFPVKGRILQAIMCECEAEGEIRIRGRRAASFDPQRRWPEGPIVCGHGRRSGHRTETMGIPGNGVEEDLRTVSGLAATLFCAVSPSPLGIPRTTTVGPRAGTPRESDSGTASRRPP